jgi:fructoselysine 6-kinase
MRALSNLGQTVYSDVAVVGDNCIDLYIDPPVRLGIGGNALNVAVNLARRGVECAYLGEIGDDENGEFVSRALRDAGVDTTGLRRVPGATWVVHIKLPANGIAVVDRELPGATGLLCLTDEDLDTLEGYHHVHLANMCKPAETLAELERRGVTTSYDFGTARDPGMLGPVHVAFFSLSSTEPEEPSSLAREAVESGARLAIVTLGAGGSLAFDGERELLVPVEPVESVDTLGAGDAYIATFIASRLAGETLDEAMTAASRDATATCLHWAAWPQQPLSASADQEHVL